MSDQNSKKAVKAGIGYTVGNVLIKGINFLALPLFSRLMTTEEFGVYNVFLSYDAILFVLIGVALHSSIRSANYEFAGKIDDYTSSITLVYLANATILLLGTWLFGNQIASVLGLKKEILYLLVLYSFGSAIISLYNNRISLDYEYKKYLLVALANSLGNVLLSLVLILSFFRAHKDIGRMLGATISIFLLSIVMLFSLYKKATPQVKKKYFRFALKYSLPIVPHGISQVLLAQFDRIMISSMVSNSAAGVYSLAGNLKLILTIISDSISTAWTTWFYSEIEVGQVAKIQKRATQLAMLFMIFAIGLMALSPELIFVLGGADYSAGKYVAIPMILDSFILFLYNIIVPSEYYSKKTIYIMLGTAFAAAINVVTNFLFIRLYGFYAAAYTTLFSYICYLVLHIMISYKLVGFNVIPLKKMIIMCLIVFIMAAQDMLFIQSTAIRWILCVVVVIPMASVLYRSYRYKN